MSLQSERIQLLMQRLSLTEMARGYEALAEQAAQKNLPYCDFLEQVLESEANVRQERNIKVRTQLAGFPDLKRLEQFDFKFPTSIDEKKIRELASLRFLERHENALFLGPPGVGKTHLAVSLGLEAIRHGFSVYFVSLPDLLDRLVQAQAENRMRKKMAHLCKCRLLVLDEIGYRSLDKQATTCLFQLISEPMSGTGALNVLRICAHCASFLRIPSRTGAPPSNCIMSETGIPKASQRRIRVNRAFTPRALRRG